tara:strand:- start:460 stop:897 length:438 start_codon:yes stop_codon:yes gene_type:complete
VSIYTTGLNNAGSFQVSGAPFATGSLQAPASSGTPIKVEFPYVTRWVKIVPITGSSATHLRVGFSANGIKDSNYFRYIAGNNLNHESAPTSPLEMKVTELYFLGDNSATVEFDVVAGLTNIPVERVNNISVVDGGTNWSGSVGVG